MRRTHLLVLCLALLCLSEGRAVSQVRETPQTGSGAGAAGYNDLAVKEYQQYLKKRPDSPHRAEVEKALSKLQKR